MAVTPLYLGPTEDNLAHIPPELTTRRQWVLWRGMDRIDHVTGAVKLNKIPINADTLTNADSTDPATWTTFAACVAALPLALEEWETEDPATYRGGGIGYVFTEDDPYVGIDLDGCVDPLTGCIADWAQAYVTQLASYTEITPSGTGLHILIQGTLPPKGRRKGGIEMYNYARFFTMTGWHVEETPCAIEARQAQLNTLWCALFGPAIGETVWLLDTQGVITNQNGCPWTITSMQYAPSGEPYAVFAETATAWPLIQCQAVPAHTPQPSTAFFDDTTLINKALEAGNKAKLQALANGNWSQDYPSQSEADLAFCCMMAFWTPDPAQVDRIYRTTALMREKWDQKRGTQTYGERTIAEAYARQTECYTPAASLVVHTQENHALNGAKQASTPSPTTLLWGSPSSPPSFDITKSRSSEDLLKLMLIPPRFLVEQLVPDGLTILGAPAKSYKSFFSLSLALATIGVGDWCDAFPVETTGDVVFFGLEAPWEQLRRRMHQLRPHYTAGQTPHKIHFFSGMKCLPPAQNGLDKAIEETIEHFRPRLIVIDPLSYLYRMGRRDDLVTATLDLLWPLAELAVKNQVAIFAPEHMRKRSKDDVSVIDTLGGSYIKPAIAQAVLMLIRQGEELVLNTTLRDAKSQDLSLTLDFDEHNLAQWGYKGTTTLLANDPNYSNLRIKILAALAGCGTALTIEELLGAGEVPDSRQNRQILARILDRAIKAKEIARINRGSYVWVGGK
jgi:putative DNA primase/helicase